MPTPFKIAPDQIETLLALVQSGALHEYNVSEISFRQADLRGRQLTNLPLAGIDIRAANLTRANLQGANLSDANLSSAVLRDANLQNADLQNARLLNADLRGADLRGAHLSGTLFADALYDANTRWPARFDVRSSGAVLSPQPGYTGSSIQAQTVPDRHRFQNKMGLGGKPSDHWKLEEGGDVENQWVLQETEQRPAIQWQLQEKPADEQEWQPVEYARPRRNPARFVLPGIVTVALLAILSYSGYVLLPRVFPSSQLAPTPTSTDVSAVAALTETPGPLDEATPVTSAVATAPAAVVETPTVAAEQSSVLEPVTPVAAEGEEALVDVQLAIVNSTYGVNSRTAPNTEAEIIRILNQGEIFFVLGQVDAEWLQLFVNDTDTQVVEGQPIAGQVGYAAAEFMQLSNQLFPADFVGEIRRIAGVSGLAIVDQEPLLPTPTPTSLDGTRASDDGSDVTATINAPSGLYIRSEPNTDAPVVVLLEEGVTRPALQRSADGAWIQIELADGTLGWGAAEFLTVNGDLNQLAVPDETGALPEPSDTASSVTNSVTSTVAITITGVITTGADPGEPYSNVVPVDTPAVIVIEVGGVNGRVSPDIESDVIDILPRGAALPIRGRSADGAWLQVELPFSRLAWVFASVVNTTGDIDSLPVTDGTATVPAPGGTAPISDTVTVPAPSDTAPVSGTATVQDIFASIYPSPGTDAGSIAVVVRGMQLRAPGRNAAGDWVQIQAEDGATGWIRTESVQLDVNIQELPIISASDAS